MDLINDAGYGYCDAQRESLKDAFAIVSGCELVGSIVAGIVMDAFGPCYTAAFGLMGQLIAIMLFVLDSQKLPTLLLAAMLSGLAINSIGLSSLHLSKLFPEKKSLYTSFVIAAQAMSTGVLPVLDSLWKGFQSTSIDRVLISYAGVAMLPAGLGFLMTLKAVDVAIEEQPIEDEKSLLLSSDSREQFSENNDFAESNDRAGPTEGLRRRRKSVIDAIQSNATVSGACDELALQSMDLITILTSPLFLVFSETILMAMTAVSYYNLSISEILSEATAKSIGNLQPLQAVFVLLWGVVSDSTSTEFVMMCHFLGYAVVYALSLVQTTAVQQTAGMLFLIFLPYTYAMKYTFVMNAWPADYHNILYGMLGTLSGVISVGLGGLNRLASETTWCYLFPVLCVAQLLPVGWLWLQSSAPSAGREQSGHSHQKGFQPI